MADKKANRVLLMGDPGVGKTALLQRHTTGEFPYEHRATVTSTVHTLSFDTNNGPLILEVVEISCHDPNISLWNEELSNVRAAIIMYDLNNRSTFENVHNWIERCDAIGLENSVIFICGNKTDLEWKVKSYEIGEYSGGLYPYEIMSMKTGYNFREPFMSIARLIMQPREVDYIATSFKPEPTYYTARTLAEQIRLAKLDAQQRREENKAKTNKIIDFIWPVIMENSESILGRFQDPNFTGHFCKFHPSEEWEDSFHEFCETNDIDRTKSLNLKRDGLIIRIQRDALGYHSFMVGI